MRKKAMKPGQVFFRKLRKTELRFISGGANEEGSGVNEEGSGLNSGQIQ